MTLKARVRDGGPLLGAAALLIVAAVFAAEMRMTGAWGEAVLLAISTVVALAVLGMGLLAARGEERPDGPATAVLMSGLVMALVALVQLAALIGEDGAGAVAAVAVAFAGIAGFAAWRCSSPVATLIAAGAVATAAIAGFEGLVGFDGDDAVPGVALAFAVLFALGAWRVDAIARHRSVQLVNAAGLAVVVLVVSQFGGLGPFIVPVGTSENIGVNGPLGWEIVSGLACAGLLAYAVLRREPGPGYLGALATVYFVSIVGELSEEQTLVGWPLVLIALAIAVTVAALRAPTASKPEPEAP